MRISISLALLLTFALCACVVQPVEKAKKEADPYYLKVTAFTALPGWAADAQSAALVPLQKSCGRILKKDAAKNFGPADNAGTYADWQAVCEKLPQDADDATARAFFEENFAPYEIWDAEDRDGLFTGYYEPMLNGSLKKKKPYIYPLYARPDDLITVNLGDFKEDLKGETVMGRVKGENLVPYFTRAEIEKGALKKQDKVVWVDNAVDAFFLHIQGSGQVRMKGGKILRVGYAAANGRAYTAIGKSLLDRGDLEKGNVSMQSIRAWLEANPEKAAEVMDINQSYVFFHKLDGDGPLGAEGVPLTPGRSLAIDKKKFPYGAPVFIDVAAPERIVDSISNADLEKIMKQRGWAGMGMWYGKTKIESTAEEKLQRLMIAQDTGGAIRGAVRGDFFWGAGDEAAHNAGVMKSAGQAYILLPKAVVVPEKYTTRPRGLKSGADASFVYND